MILDAHSHVHDPLDAHLSALDAAGVHRTVLFPTRAHPERATDLDSLHHEMGALERALAGGSGDDGFALALRELDEALTAHPDRFLGFGSVPLGRPDAETAARVERDVTGRGLYGIGELTPPPNRAALVEPVLRAAQEHTGLPVVVHGAAPTTAADVRTLAELPTRTFFGSDAPYGDPVVARTTVERVTSSGEVRDRVLGGNLAELLGLG